MKRPSTDNDRYNELDRKRTSNDRRFEPPPPPRFTTTTSNYDRPPEKKRVDDYPASSSKRNDDYKSSSRGGAGSLGNTDVTSFKRPINDGYKRSNDIDPPSRSGSGGYDQRGVVSSMGSSAKDNRFNDSVDNRHIRYLFNIISTGQESFMNNSTNRGSMSSSKSRYLDNHSNGGSNDRYSDRTSSTSSSAWANPNNGPPTSVKSFGGLPVTNDVWVRIYFKI